MTAKKRNPQDLTRRNLLAQVTRNRHMRDDVTELKREVRSLQRRVKKLETS
jgi:hypothetical protein